MKAAVQVAMFGARQPPGRPSWLALAPCAVGCVRPERPCVPGGPWWWLDADGRWGGPCATHAEAWDALRGGRA